MRHIQINFVHDNLNKYFRNHFAHESKDKLSFLAFSFDVLLSDNGVLLVSSQRRIEFGLTILWKRKKQYIVDILLY